MTYKEMTMGKSKVSAIKSQSPKTEGSATPLERLIAARKVEAAKPPVKLPARKPIEEPKFTLLDAFTYEDRRSNSTLDLQKALLSCSYLMAWTSKIGNENPDGYSILGLANIIEGCAAEVEELFSQDDIYDAGSTPHEIREAKQQREAERYRRREERGKELRCG
jgi:hypothetical protein